MPLSDKTCKNAKPSAKPTRYADGGGMYLEVMPNGSRYWRLKYRFLQKEKRLALGVYPQVSLAEALIRVLERNDARLYAQTRAAIRLLMLTFVRTSELTEAKWNEINFEAREWVIPAERMKMRRPHVVPLATQTISVLKDLHALTGRGAFVFPNQAHPRRHTTSRCLSMHPQTFDVSSLVTSVLATDGNLARQDPHEQQRAH